jgi:hypothetical protein
MNLSENQKELVIIGIKKVQDLASRELRASEKILIVNGDIQMKEEEDYRVSFVQAVENLSSLLLPHFDTRMQDYYSKNIVYLEGWHSEIAKCVEDEHFKKVYGNAPESSADKSIKIKSDIMLALQCRRAKQFFNELNFFIQRNDILKDSQKQLEAKKHE